MLPAILAGLGSFAGTPIGQDVIRGGYNKAANWFRGGPAAQAQLTPEQQAQQNYLQQIQQPFQLGSAQRQQQLMNQFNQQIVPGLKNQFAGTGAGLRSSAFGQQLGEAGSNLATNLGALGEENALQEAGINQGRLGQLGGYLGGQQQLGLQGTIANRDAMLRAMGMMQNYDLGQQQQNTNRLGAYGNVLGGLGQIGMRQPFETINQPGQKGGFEEAVSAMVKRIIQGG